MVYFGVPWYTFFLGRLGGEEWAWPQALSVTSHIQLIVTPQDQDPTEKTADNDDNLDYQLFLGKYGAHDISFDLEEFRYYLSAEYTIVRTESRSYEIIHGESKKLSTARWRKRWAFLNFRDRIQPGWR